MAVCATAIVNELDSDKKPESFASFISIVLRAAQMLIRLLSHWIAATAATYRLLEGAETIQMPEVAGHFLPAIYSVEQIAANPELSVPAGPSPTTE